MKKRVLIGTTLALSLLVSGTAMAAGYSNPAEILSSLTKKPVEQVYEQRTEGKTYGEIAKDEGVLDKYKKEVLEYKNDIIDQRVKEGVISKENADKIKKEMAERITDCDGTPDPDRERLGRKYGGGLGLGRGNGQGAGGHQGLGNGGGMGFGRTLNQ